MGMKFEINGNYLMGMGVTAFALTIVQLNNLTVFHSLAMATKFVVK